MKLVYELFSENGGGRPQVSTMEVMSLPRLRSSLTFVVPENVYNIFSAYEFTLQARVNADQYFAFGYAKSKGIDQPAEGKKVT